MSFAVCVRSMVLKLTSGMFETDVEPRWGSRVIRDRFPGCAARPRALLLVRFVVDDGLMGMCGSLFDGGSFSRLVLWVGRVNRGFGGVGVF